MSATRDMSPRVVTLISLLLSELLLCWSMLAHPRAARCPDGWWLRDGIRRDGSFSCRRPPLGGDDDVLTGRSTAVDQPGELRARIYCTGGAVPIVREDGRTVGCQR
jgi:hypothetical protein